MNEKIFRIKILEGADGIFEVEGLARGNYDEQATKYDKLVGNAIYNKIMWGNSPSDYSEFARKSLYDSNDGIVIDLGCGSLIFTSGVYANYNKRKLFLCDYSAEMLKIGKSRIDSRKVEHNSVSYLRADAFNMPFRDNTIQTILSFGIFHVFEKSDKLVLEIKRMLKPDGFLHLTSLCTERKLSAKYLKLLNKKGHVAKPLNSDEICRIIDQNGLQIVERKVKGGMVYIKARKG